MSHIIEVPAGFQKKYAIHIGTGLWKQIQDFITSRYSNRLGIVVIDENVYRLHGDIIVKQFQQYFKRIEIFTVPRGEQSKNIGLWNKIVDFALNNEAERSTPLFALGGGVTGDLAGFAASAIHRGVPLVHIPTTLLAMVDSSIGGKTGVNHTAGKNLVGAFYQPDAVFADTRFLETLDRHEWINGLSEILKYGAIHSPGIFETARQLIGEEGFIPSESWTDLISQSARIKTEIVNEDTLETGKRAFLNFGHTFGHALEKVAGYGTVSHGEAIFAGMIAATNASQQLNADIQSTRFEYFKSLYPFKLNELIPDANKLPEAMMADKKVHEGHIRLVLLNEWGKPYIYTCKDAQLIKESWAFAFEQFK